MGKNGKILVAIGLVVATGAVITGFVTRRRLLTISKAGQILKLDFSNYQAGGDFGINMRANKINVNTWFNLPGQVDSGKTVSFSFGSEITSVYLHPNDVVDFTLFDNNSDRSAILVSNSITW